MEFLTIFGVLSALSFFPGPRKTGKARLSSANATQTSLGTNFLPPPSQNLQTSPLPNASLFVGLDNANNSLIGQSLFEPRSPAYTVGSVVIDVPSILGNPPAQYNTPITSTPVNPVVTPVNPVSPFGTPQREL
jgi:hypothetical protein